jgi:serine/threonine-protein kinase
MGEALASRAENPPRAGKYQLLRRVATGGMAELFLARSTGTAGFQKLVVLKRILPQHAESEEFIGMFLHEARLAATLQHPNIVQVYDIGEDGDAYFFAMEYVQGQDLRKIVRAARKAERTLPLEHVLHVIEGVAAGLHHAHEKTDLDGKALGIVHRDVSPSNVLVTYDGAVKLVDFGIAKATTAQTSTVAGTLKGKIPYMSPEQCRGERVDRRSDVFSIGTLLWELTTGTRLFSGDSEFAILNRVARGDVPLPSTIQSDYPPELEAVVMKALQLDPAQRYQTALELQVDLEDFAREARLPVSSARVGMFMRELFADEMAQEERMMAERLEAASPSLLGARDPGDLTPSDVRRGVPGLGAVTRETSAHTVVLDEGELPRPSRFKWIALASAALGGLALAAVMVVPGLRGAERSDAEPAAAPSVIEAPVVEPEPAPAEKPAPAVVLPIPAEPMPPQPVVGATDDADIVLESTAAAKSSDTVTKPRPSRKGKPREDKKPGKKPKWDPDSPLPPM